MELSTVPSSDCWMLLLLYDDLLLIDVVADSELTPVGRNEPLFVGPLRVGPLRAYMWPGEMMQSFFLLSIWFEHWTRSL